MKLPDPLTRRHWLEGDTAAERCVAVAEAYQEDGRDSEAIAFLEKAGATEALDAMLAGAVEAGDGFLAQAVARALGRDVTKDEWQALGAAAGAAGKERYRELAERQANA